MLKTRFIPMLLGLSLSSAALAHFQLVYTPEMLRERGGKITLKMPFTHPGESGHVMKMPRPNALYVVHKGKNKDLSDTLQEIPWRSASNTNTAWQVEAKLRGLGDFIFVLEPAPYYEAAEDIYIQQITKAIINVGSLPTGWDQPLGLKTEIRPLVRPYALYTGGLFRGVVLSNGKPVPYAEIEVEHINYRPNMANNRFGPHAAINYPFDAYANHSIRADANGRFSFAIPSAGHWGFAALNVGPDKQYKGKTLSQDAVIWVQARDLERN